MTQPQPQPQPGPEDQPQDPQPPQGSQQDAPQDQDKNDPGKDDIARLTATLDDERKLRKELQAKLHQIEQDQLSEQEKAVAAARDEGRAEAATSAARRLAATEFRYAAKGRIADPAAALELLDVSKLLKDGEPDADLIAAAIDRLAGPEPDDSGHQPAGRVPSGPRQPANEGDFFRQVLRGQRRLQLTHKAAGSGL